VTRRILEMEGAFVEVAHNGLEAVDRLCARRDAADIVLMDVQMPVLNGYDATRHIRQDLELTDLPVIALTASALSSERMRAIDAGMNDFIVKPFNAKDLVRSIRRLVNIDATRSIESDSAPSLSRATAGVASQPWPTIDGIDAADVHARLGGDAGLFRSLLRRFFEEFTDLSKLRTHTSDDLAATAASLHKLLGGAGLLGATKIQKLAREGEAACLAGQGDAASKLILRLGKLLRQLVASAQPALTQTSVTTAVLDTPRLSTAIAALIKLLRRQSLVAVAEFAAIAPNLAQQMDGPGFGLLQSDIDNLRFDAAAERLVALAMPTAA
jgi:CheY-like chemotaxis protein